MNCYYSVAPVSSLATDEVNGSSFQKFLLEENQDEGSSPEKYLYLL
jgi:hypothetical protein